MAVASLFRRVLGRELLNFNGVTTVALCQVQPRRNRWKPVEVPKPGINGKCYRRIVHFKDEYTVEPLEVTNLGGRDPVTGRVVAKCIGGGVKHKYHWIQWIRDGPTDPNAEPKQEVVLEVFKDGCRTSYVALVGCGRELKYILATENMKPGDTLRTHNAIPLTPVRPNEGDAYPLGALPWGTLVHCVEKYPGLGGFLIHAAGTCGIVKKREDDRVIVRMPSKREFSLHESCMATVGRLSNVDHGSTPLGSVQKSRELGIRPRSGLWQRKTGRFGRKIKPPPPVRKFDSLGKVVPRKELALNISGLNE